LPKKEAVMDNKKNGFAIGSFVCALIGLIGSFIPVVKYFAIILTIVGIVLGAKGRKKAAEGCSGGGLATAGLVLGIIGTVFCGISILCALVCVGAVEGLDAAASANAYSA